jgi:siroheme synthase
MAAGPGDPGLWTVRAERLLAAAPVVVCDPELAAAVAALAPRATVVAVADDHEAAAVTVAHGRRHDGVVRVARGDRLVWEAGGAEGAALRAAGLDHEVVPAVVAAFAVPAAAGVPVMVRPLTATLAVAVGVPVPPDTAGTVVSTGGAPAPAGAGPAVTLPGPLVVRGAVAALDLTGRSAAGATP